MTVKIEDLINKIFIKFKKSNSKNINLKKNELRDFILLLINKD